jgi:hypothetical protein
LGGHVDLGLLVPDHWSARAKIEVPLVEPVISGLSSFIPVVFEKSHTTGLQDCDHLFDHLDWVVEMIDRIASVNYGEFTRKELAD